MAKQSKHRILKIVLVVVLALVCAGALGIHVYASNYYHALPEANEAEASTDAVQVQQLDNGDVTLVPTDGARAAFVFYPGGKVEAKAYLPLLKRLAQQNVACVLVKMPENLAVLAPNRADRGRAELEQALEAGAANNGNGAVDDTAADDASEPSNAAGGDAADDASEPSNAAGGDAADGTSEPSGAAGGDATDDASELTGGTSATGSSTNTTGDGAERSLGGGNGNHSAGIPWMIGGHSLGGAMAASYAAGHTASYQGLVLLAAYSTSDLTSSGLRVLSVYGSNDGVLNRDTYQKDFPNLPPDTTEYVIDGGIHSYFGVYGHQDGDGEATISNDEQLDLTARAIATFADSL